MSINTRFLNECNQLLYRDSIFYIYKLNKNKLLDKYILSENKKHITYNCSVGQDRFNPIMS